MIVLRINYDLLREILLDVADHDMSYDLACNNLVYDDLPRTLINYHVHILVNEGYLKGINACSKDGYDYLCIELTMKGQAFLEKIENKSVWHQIKTYLSNNTVSISFTAIELAFKSIG